MPLRVSRVKSKRLKTYEIKSKKTLSIQKLFPYVMIDVHFKALHRSGEKIDTHAQGLPSSGTRARVGIGVGAKRERGSRRVSLLG